MNIRGFQIKNKLALFFLLLLALSCKKEKDIIYQVEDVEVKRYGSDKEHLKSTIEFISIAYADIFNTTIPQNKLSDLTTAYLSFGDKKLIEKVIIRNFLNQPGAILPTQAEMFSDINKFVKDTYKKFYNRDPDEYEEWYMVELIKEDETITPDIVYLAFLTSNEYRYY